MNRKRFVGDWAMLGTVFGLILFGLLMIYSASNYTARLHMGNAFYYVERQIFTVTSRDSSDVSDDETGLSPIA